METLPSGLHRNKVPIPAGTALSRSQIMTIFFFDFYSTMKSSGLAEILLQELSVLAFASGAFHRLVNKVTALTIPERKVIRKRSGQPVWAKGNGL